MSTEEQPDVFTGIDAGEFILKASAKVSTSEFRSPILQKVVDSLAEKYSQRLKDLMEGVESKLQSAKAAKALRLVVFEEEELRKAIGKDGHQKEGGYTKVSHPGARGGKFWIDPKGHVRYDERPGAPTPKHREATDEEVSDFVKKQVTPTLFVGHDDDTMKAILKSGVFDESDLQYIEWFRENVLKDEAALGELEGVHDLDDLDARNFTSASGTTGAKGVKEWLEAWWVQNIRDEDLFGGDKSQVPTMQQAKEWFDDLLQKYSEATKNPKVQVALKENFIRLQRQADSAESDVLKTKDVSEKLGSVLLAPPNIEDGALTGMALMKGMNLLFLPTSGKELARSSGGKTNKRMKGQIHVNEMTVNALKSGQINLIKAGANEAQAMMFVIAGHLSEHKDEETGKYDDSAFRGTDKELLTDLSDYKFGRKFTDLLEEKSGNKLSAGEKKHYAQRIAELGEKIAQTINDQHDGNAPGVEEIMSSNTTKLLEKPDAIEAIRAKISDNLENTKELIDAQNDSEWKLPANGPMGQGKYGGMSGKKAQPHQINPQTGKPFELFSHQKQGINWMEKAKRGILAHGAGLGKAQPLSALILTPSGFVRMGSLKVGDKVIGSDGRAKRVRGVYPQGKKKVYRIFTNDGREVECCDDHLWLTSSYREHRRSPDKWSVKATHEIRNSLIARPGTSRSNPRLNHRLPKISPVCFESQSVLPIRPYLLGLLLGDGSLGVSTLGFHNPEFDLQDSVRELLPFGDELVDASQINPDGLNFRIKGGNLLAKLKSLGLSGVDSYTKFIPKEYLYSSVKDRVELLRGLCDSDGSVNESGQRVEYTTSSSKLHDDVEFLVRSLGGLSLSDDRIPTYTYKGKKLKGAKSYRIRLYFDNRIIPVSSDKHLQRWKDLEGITPYHQAIQDVVFVGLKECQCISIDSEDSLYVTNDFILTHNTTEAVAFIEHMKAKGSLKRGIFFLPPALIPQWVKEIEDYAPGNTILDLSRFPAADREAILKSDLAKEASYILVSKGVLTGGDDDEGPKEEMAGDGFHEALSNIDDAALFVDECFPAGTSIDGKSIEDRKIGEYVTSFDEKTQRFVKKRITFVFKSRPKHMVRVKTSDGSEQVVTAGHPFWSISGWKRAGALHEGGFILRYLHGEKIHEEGIDSEDSVQLLRKDRTGLRVKIRRERITPSQERQSVLLSGASSEIKVGVFLVPYEKGQSDEIKDHTRESSYSTPFEWLETSSPRRQRQTTSSSSVTASQYTRLVDRGGCEDENGSTLGLPKLLQARYSQHQIENSDRSRWQFSQQFGTTISRQEEGGVSSWVRVESVEILESGSDGTFGGLCPDGHVYNLEVEDTHTYVANGFVVHNCHQGGFKNPDNAAYKITNKVLTGREYAFGMTATPLPNAPQDLFHMTNLFAPGTLGKYSTWEGRLADASWNPDANGGVGGYEVANFSDLKELNERAKPRVFVKKFDDPDVAKELAKVLPAAPKPETNKVFLSSKPGSNGISQLDYVHHGIPKMVEKRIEEIEAEREEAGEEPLPNAGMVAKLITLNLQRQATISPELIDPKYKGPAPKIDDCVNHIINHFKPGGGNDKGKGIAVFCNFKKAFPILKRALAAKGIDPSIIGEVHGDSTVNRGATQDAFNGTEKDGKFDSKVKIMLVGIKAGGAGLNLQKGGNAAYFLDEPFTAADKEQAIGRVFRVGQKDPVKLTTVMAHGSYDERMNAMISSKNAIAQALLVRDSSKVDQVLTNTSKLLGVEVPAPPKPEVMKKFEEMKNLVQLRAGDVDDIWDSIQDKDGGGSLQDNEIVVDPQAKNSLPPHLRHTYDLKQYERERRAKMEIDNAKMYAKNDRLVGERFFKDGDKVKGQRYLDRAERLEKLANGAKEQLKSAKPSKTESERKIAEVHAAIPTKMAENDPIVVIPHKKNPYNGGSKKRVDSSRDFALGVKDKEDHMTHEHMDYFYNEIRKQKPATMKEFISTILKPAYAGAKITPAQLKETAQQIFHHLRSDGLISNA